jgi:two-component system response regulator FlrC
MRSNQAWSLSEGAQRTLLSHPWPGNVRELENIIQRAMVLCPGTHIDTQHLMFDDASPCCLLAMAPVASPNAATSATPAPATTPSQILAPGPLYATVKHSEHHAIRAALDTSSSREEAAQKLGISPRTLRYKLARLRDAASGLSAHS